MTEIIQGVPWYIKDLELRRTMSKYVLYIGTREKEYIRLGEKAGHAYVRWGVHMDHPSPHYQKKYIRRMRDENHKYPVRFVIVKHPITKVAYIWCDNMHHTIRNMLVSGKPMKNVCIGDMVDYYVVDMTDDKQIRIYDSGNCVDKKQIEECIRILKKRSLFTDKDVLNFNYTIGEFCEKNRRWLMSI